MQTNYEAAAMHQSGLAAARSGHLEYAHRVLDQTLRVLEADTMHDTRFLRAGVMCNLGMILIMRALATDDQSIRRDYFRGAHTTLYHANATSTDELTRHFRPAEGGGYYEGLSTYDQAVIHAQIGATYGNMGYLDYVQAELRDAAEPGSGRYDREAAERCRWLARHHFKLAGEAVSPAAFIISAAQGEFFAAPVEDRENIAAPHDDDPEQL